MPEFSVLKAAPSQATEISQLIQGLAHYFLGEARSAAAQPFLTTFEPAAIAALITDPACKYFVAMKSGLLVGVCAIKDRKHIYHLFVAPEAQGRGVARALWESARADAELDGATGSFTVNSSLYAVPVYERLGFHATDAVQERNGVRFVPMASVR